VDDHEARPGVAGSADLTTAKSDLGFHMFLVSLAVHASRQECISL